MFRIWIRKDGQVILKDLLNTGLKETKIARQTAADYAVSFKLALALSLAARLASVYGAVLFTAPKSDTAPVVPKIFHVLHTELIWRVLFIWPRKDDFIPCGINKWKTPAIRFPDPEVPAAAAILQKKTRKLQWFSGKVKITIADFPYSPFIVFVLFQSVCPVKRGVLFRSDTSFNEMDIYYFLIWFHRENT